MTAVVHVPRNVINLKHYDKLWSTTQTYRYHGNIYVYNRVSAIDPGRGGGGGRVGSGRFLIFFLRQKLSKYKTSSLDQGQKELFPKQYGTLEFCQFEIQEQKLENISKKIEPSSINFEPASRKKRRDQSQCIVKV